MTSPPRNRTLTAALLVALTLGLAACGGSGGNDGNSGNGDKAAEGPLTLGIQNFAFKPATLEVPAGSRIRVTNQDSAPHTVTADDRSFDTGNIAAGAGAELTAPRAGEVPYHCNIHDYMRGVIRVTPQ